MSIRRFQIAMLTSVLGLVSISAFARPNLGAPLSSIQSQWPVAPDRQSSPFQDVRVGQRVEVETGAAAFNYVVDCGIDNDRKLTFAFSIETRTTAIAEGVLTCGQNTWVLVSISGHHVIINFNQIRL